MTSLEGHCMSTVWRIATRMGIHGRIYFISVFTVGGAYVQGYGVGGQGFFSKFLMGGLKIFGPRRGRSQMGGLAKKIRLNPKLPT